VFGEVGEREAAERFSISTGAFSEEFARQLDSEGRSDNSSLIEVRLFELVHQ